MGEASAGGRAPPGPMDTNRNEIKFTNTEHVRYLDVKAKDSSVKLGDLNEFVINKYIDFITQKTGPKDARQRGAVHQTQRPCLSFTTLRTGEVRIHTTNSKQTNKILKAKKFGNINIEVTIPIHMNTTRGVINLRGLNNMQEEEIIDELNSADVIGARHFRRKTDNVWVNTNTMTNIYNSKTTHSNKDRLLSY